MPEVERAGVTLRAGAVELVPAEAADDDAAEAEVPGVTVLLAVVPEAAELPEELLLVLAEVPEEVLLLGAAVVLRLTPALLALDEALDAELLEVLAEVLRDGLADELAEVLLDTLADELLEALEEDLFCEELAVVGVFPRLA